MIRDINHLLKVNSMTQNSLKPGKVKVYSMQGFREASKTQAVSSVIDLDTSFLVKRVPGKPEIEYAIKVEDVLKFLGVL